MLKKAVFKFLTYNNKTNSRDFLKKSSQKTNFLTYSKRSKMNIKQRLGIPFYKYCGFYFNALDVNNIVPAENVLPNIKLVINLRHINIADFFNHQI